MKPLPVFALLALAAAALGGCKTAADYERNNAATAAWLSAHAGSPGMNVAGHWDSSDWGEAHFQQSGNKVTGILGDYPIGGVIDGQTLFLAITEHGWTSHTAILRPGAEPGTLVGNSSDEVPFSLENHEPLSLARAPQ